MFKHYINVQRYVFANKNNAYVYVDFRKQFINVKKHTSLSVM